MLSLGYCKGSKLKSTQIFGCKQQKDSAEIFEVLQDKGIGKIALVTSKKKHELMLSPKKLLEQGEKYRLPQLVLEDEKGEIAATLAKIICNEPPGKHIIVMGSFNLMFEAREYFGYNDYVDPELESNF